jgi:hypothetical protein
MVLNFVFYISAASEWNYNTGWSQLLVEAVGCAALLLLLSYPYAFLEDFSEEGAASDGLVPIENSFLGFSWKEVIEFHTG